MRVFVIVLSACAIGGHASDPDACDEGECPSAATALLQTQATTSKATEEEDELHQVISAESVANLDEEGDSDDEEDADDEADAETEEQDLVAEDSEGEDFQTTEALEADGRGGKGRRGGKGKKAPAPDGGSGGGGKGDKDEAGGEAKKKGGGKGGKGGKTKLSADDKAACPSGGKLVDGKCWHIALPATSCEETCVEKDLQYDEATDLGRVTRTNVDAKDKCLGIAAKLGYPGKKEKMMQWAAQGCGCVVYRIAAYGKGDEVRLNHGDTNAKCSKTSTITGRVCACKKAAAIGESCSSSSNCGNSYCKSGTCAKLLAQGNKCTEHTSCTTGYCSPTESTCSILAWKQPTQGAFAKRYLKSGNKRSTQLRVPNWADMTEFPKGFCLGYYATSTGCMIAKGIDRKKTIAKAKQRCAVSKECMAVWCCATACPATTCYATKAEAPNYKAKDCPDAPGSFHETKYPNSFYVKDAPNQALPTPEKVSHVPAEDKDEPEDAADADEQTIYKQVAQRTSCSSGKRLKGERTLEDCAEAVKQREGLAFGWKARRKSCVMAPNSWSECSDDDLSDMKKSGYELFELEPGAGDEEFQQD